MPEDVRTQLRMEASALPGVTREAAAAFKDQFLELLHLVNSRLSLESQVAGEQTDPGQASFLRDTHRYFGESLLAIFDFGILDGIVDVFLWLTRMMRSRGFGEDYFVSMIDAWVAGLHALIGPSLVHQLAGPLLLLRRHLTSFLRGEEAAAKQERPEQKIFLQHLLNKRRRDASDFMISLVKGDYSPERLCHEVVMPCLEQIGRMWQDNQVNVADEHAATEICRYVVLRLYDHIPRQPPLSHKAFVGCVQGEEHCVAVEWIAVHLESQGWNVFSMGRGSPTPDTVIAAGRYEPDVIFLSVSLIRNLPSARSLLQRLKERAPDSKIILGGAAAVLAREQLEPLADAIMNDVKESHVVALQLIRGHA